VAIGVVAILEDEGSIESLALSAFILDIENVSRRAGAEAIVEIAGGLGLPRVLVDAAAYRTLVGPDALFWIDEIGTGSKIIKGVILPAVLAVTLESTVGESLKEGWVQTHAHQQIVQAIPKFEKYIVERFKQVFERPPMPDEGHYRIQRVGIRSDEEGWKMEIRASARKAPFR
jgi:hypothetical protein